MAFVDGSADFVVKPALSGGGSMLLGSAAELDVDIKLDGNLVNAAVITNVRTIAPTRLRVDFNAPLDKNAALEDISNWTVNRLTPSAVDITIFSIEVPSLDLTRSVDLVISEMTNSASYEMGVISTEITSGGEPVVQDLFPFVGLGEPPTIVVVVATSETTAEVRFSENIQDTAAARNAANYVFDLGLSVAAVTDVEGDIVTLETGEQDPDVLYTLTVTATILDNASNPLSVPVDSAMLGFMEPEVVEKKLRQDMYSFLIQGIRAEDQKAAGAQFVERYLKGPQEVWCVISQVTDLIPVLWDVVNIPDRFLPFLKPIVGWTGALTDITDRLDDDTCRRLVAASVPFWKRRGPADTIQDIIRLTTGARVRILDYFDFRWVTGETHLGEEHDGNDPWCISLGPEGTNVYQIRVVDDGSLDRELIVNLAKLTRPTNERVEIVYIRFLEEFNVDGDKSQFTDEIGESVVANGTMVLPADVVLESVFVDIQDSLTWTDYVVSWRVKGNGEFDLPFYRTTEDDHYYVRVTTSVASPSGNGRLELFKRVSGGDTSLDSIDLGEEYDLRSDVYHTIRVVCVREEGTNRIRVVLDDNQLLNTTDNALTAGSFGLRRNPGSGVATLDDLEMFFLPVQSDFVDINP